MLSEYNMFCSASTTDLDRTGIAVLRSYESIQSNMNLNDQNSEPVTELGLALGYSYHAIHGSLNNSSGAGANAVLRTGISFNPLSELVWSPTKGLNLKCADRNFANSKLSLAWGAGPSQVILSPSHARRTEENLIKSLIPLDVKTEVGIQHNFIKSLRGDAGGEKRTGIKNQVKMEAESNTQPAELCNSSFPDEPKNDAAANEPLTEHTTGRAANEPLTEHTTGRAIDVNCVDAQTSRTEIILASEVNATTESNFHNTIVHNTAVLSAEHRKPEKTCRNYMKGTGSEGAPDIMEVTAENNLQITFDKTVRGKIISLESDPEVKNSLRKDERGVNPSVSHKHSPTNSSVRKYQRKGKAKALSDGHVGKKLSNEDDDSHESVESCNSAQIFSNGKRRWNFEQQLIVANKRGKTQLEESPSSTSNMKQDSSFVNWISNMMKGFLKSNPDEPGGDGNMSAADQDRSNIGFQSLFQSLYSAKTKVEETRMLDGYNKAEPDLALPTQPKVFPASIVACQENSSDNKISCNLEHDKDKGTIFNPSLGKPITCSLENIDPKLQPEGKTTDNANYRTDLVGNLWITRFAPKISGPSSNLDPCNKNYGSVAIPYSQDYVGASKNHEILQHSTEDPNNAMEKELWNSTGYPEASINLGNEQKSLNKLNHIMLTPRLKISEAMASIFAKRLGHLKHIMPLEAADNNACTIFTCSYCGRKGHHLKDCSEVTDTELEDLLRNINASKYIEEMSFCIRCFQRDHWAVTCPLGRSTFLANYPNDVRISETHDKMPKPLNTVGSQSQGANARKACARNEASLIDLNHKLNETPFEKLRYSACSDMKFIASSSGRNKMIENPKGVFDAVKSLRLSRIDILKWITSETPLSRLDGFYLRLRLGKWQEGSGGTGYSVACITETQRDASIQTSQTSIYVGVGGIKCLVESQYISNQDFLEDELKAWWDATLKRGGEVPSEESLSSKLKERKMLGI